MDSPSIKRLWVKYCTLLIWILFSLAVRSHNVTLCKVMPQVDARQRWWSLLHPLVAADTIPETSLADHTVLVENKLDYRKLLGALHIHSQTPA